MTKAQQPHLTRHEILALRGLRLPKSSIRRLQQAGIYCEPSVSIEYDQQSRIYVLRARESGGAVAETGAYCGFVNSDGSNLPWLTRVRTVGRNGVHAIVVSHEFVRLHVFRDGQTYSLLITHHWLKSQPDRKRPTLENHIVFHAVYGELAMDLWDKDRRFGGSVLPLFNTKSGTRLRVPERYEEAAKQIVAAVNCTGCQHCHLAQPPQHVASRGGHSGEAAIGRNAAEKENDE